MATTVYYGDVILHNVNTKSWDETVLYDDSGTDPIGKRYLLMFDAVVHQQGLGDGSQLTAPVYSVDNGQHADAPSRMVTLLRKLEQPRHRLRVVIGEVTVLDVNPTVNSPYYNNDTYTHIEDIDNGPKPQSVKIFHIASDKVFRIRFSISASVNNCIAGKARVPNAINNRWSVQEAMDDNFAIHRTITGKIRLNNAADVQNQIDPLAFRGLAFPPLEDGFRRQSVSYVSDVTGLGLNYQIVDVQSRYAAPWPATRISGSHSTQTLDGHRFVSSATCRLVGPPHCAVPDLIARAVQFTQYRINWQSALQENSNITRILDAYIREDIGDHPTVEVGVRVEEIYKDEASIVAKTKNDNWGKLDFGPLGSPLTPTFGNNPTTYRVNWHPSISPFGSNEYGGERSALSTAFLRCVLGNQCYGANAITGTPATVDAAPAEEDRYESTLVNDYGQSPSLSDPNAASTWSDEHLTAMYMAVSHTNKYLWRQPIAQLPVASNTSSGASATLTQLAPAVSLRQVVVDYERLGQPPKIPQWQAHKIGAANVVPAAMDVEILPPKLTDGGDNYIYRAIGTYLYFCDRAIGLGEEVPVGRLPVNSQDISDKIDLDNLFDPFLL